MSDAGNPFGFGKLVPGFDFLQNLMTAAAKGGGAQAPGLSNWIAPTLSVEDLERRIGELKAVHFWLEQNGKALTATIQALEVQKMTLATLKGMNFAIGDVARAFTVKPAQGEDAAARSTDRSAEPSAAKQAAKTYAKSFENAAAPAPGPAAAEPAASEPQAAAAAPAGSGRREEKEEEAGAADGAAAKPAGAGVVDPLQWWGALTSQFQQIAANAMRDAADNPALKASRDIAANALKSANEMTASLTGAARAGASDKSDRAGAAAMQDKAPARKTAATKKTARKTGARKSAAKTAAKRE